jgi:hypothetical protein
VGSLFRQQKVFRSSCARPGAPGLTDVRGLLIDTPGGGHVRLGDVATVRVRPTPACPARGELAAHRRRRRARARPAGGQDEVTDRIRRASFRSVPRAGDRRLSGDGRPWAGCWLPVWPRRRDVLLLQAAFGGWLASLAFLTLPIALLGGEVAG